MMKRCGIHTDSRPRIVLLLLIRIKYGPCPYFNRWVCRGYRRQCMRPLHCWNLSSTSPLIPPLIHITHQHTPVKHPLHNTHPPYTHQMPNASLCITLPLHILYTPITLPKNTHHRPITDPSYAIHTPIIHTSQTHNTPITHPSHFLSTPITDPSHTY